MIALLAQSGIDIGNVPPEYVKYWWQVAGFAIVIGLQVYNTFFKTQKREITGRVVNEEEPVFADADDVEELQEGATEIGVRITEIQQTFASSLHDLGQDTLKAMGEVKVMASRHEALLEQMEKRLSSLEGTHADDVRRLHARIDDAMKRK